MKFDTLKIIPGQKPEVPAWFKTALWASFAFLLAGGIMFLALIWQMTAFNSKKEKLVQQITELESQGGNKILEEQVFKIAAQVEDFSRLTKEHKINSIFFDFLRALCHPKVQFTGFKLDAKNNSAELSGKTENFQTLGEQVAVLTEDKNIKDLKLSNISFDQNGKVLFRLNFHLEANLLNNSNQ